jgi:hypothetical protein
LFRAACNRLPEPMPVALPAPAANPAIVAKVRNAISAANQDAMAWAYRLKSREERGDRLTPFQRHCWREALR